MAERRREALDESLKENEMLHEKVASLEDELNISRAMLDETKNLVEVLTEMINEPDTDPDNNSQTDSDDCDGSSEDFTHTSIAEEAKEEIVIQHEEKSTLTDDTENV